MSHKGYRYLPHTADVKFEAYGKTIEEAFSNAIFAMVNLMVDIELIDPTTTKKISLSGHDKEALLYNLLEEILFIYETSSLLPYEIDNMRIVLNGRPCLEARLRLGNAKDVRDYIKAVTYNEMEIKETDSGWRICVVLDV